MKSTQTPEQAEKPKHVVVTVEQAQASLSRFMTALYNATDDAATTLQIVDKLSEGIEADPALSKKVFTPENIEKVMALQRKSQAGKITLDDLLQAFPIIGEMVPAPLLGMFKSFMK